MYYEPPYIIEALEIELEQMIAGSQDETLKTPIQEEWEDEGTITTGSGGDIELG